MDVKNLSTAVSNAHVEVYVVICCRLRLISRFISLSSSFSSLKYTDLFFKSLRERLLGIVHKHKIMGKKSQNVYIWLEVFTYDKIARFTLHFTFDLSF